MVALHDEQSEGLPRRIILRMVQTASGNKLTEKQAAHTWDRTIFPLGKRLGLLTGYVIGQEGTSKRTAAGNGSLQRRWYVTVTKLFDNIRCVALEVLHEERLVRLMMPWLVVNLDEECLQASASRGRIVGAKSKTKHDNQAGTSRHVARCYHFRFLFYF